MIRSIAFVSSRPNADGSADWRYEIHVMDALGEMGPLAGATRLTTDSADDSGWSPADSHVTWSPDGTRLAFLSSGRGTERDACDLWVMDAVDVNGTASGTACSD
ncbi:MAG: PD40 domain-containing protein [Chloroflexi bacterium]|nr:PD40 domain-containing protein [Chloroflexota bacterium]